MNSCILLLARSHVADVLDQEAPLISHGVESFEQFPTLCSAGALLQRLQLLLKQLNACEVNSASDAGGWTKGKNSV